MHAKMSDRNARAATFDTMPRASWMLPSERVWTVEDLWAWSAEVEARAILAETEQEEYCARYVAPGRLPFACCDGEGASALAESLRSFLEA